MAVLVKVITEKNVFLIYEMSHHKFVAVVQSLSHVWLLATPYIAAHQTALSSTISWSLLKFMSIESVILTNHLILCCPFSSCLQAFPASGCFSVSWLFASGGQNIGASASAKALPVNIQGWFPLGLTGLICIQSRDSQESLFQHHNSKASILSAQPSLLYVNSDKGSFINI